MQENSIVAPKRMLGFSELKQWLRHKHPMIYLDRVLDYTPSQSLHAMLAISGNMDCMAGHFPERAIFPATHLQQSFCQAAVILLQLSTERLGEEEMAVVASMNSRFYKSVVPGDTVHILIKIERLYTTSLIFSGTALVDNVRVASIKATMMRTNISKVEKPLW